MQSTATARQARVHYGSSATSTCLPLRELVFDLDGLVRLELQRDHVRRKGSIANFDLMRARPKLELGQRRAHTRGLAIDDHLTPGRYREHDQRCVGLGANASIR